MGPGVGTREKEQRECVRAFLSTHCSADDWKADPYRALRRFLRLRLHISIGIRGELGSLADEADNSLDATVTDVYLGAQSAIREGLGLATASPFGLLEVIGARLATGDMRVVSERAGSVRSSSRFSDLAGSRTSSGAGTDWG